eukprot:scaffold73080_cov66-Phaeocystis_antarctica.AAC.2
MPPPQGAPRPRAGRPAPVGTCPPRHPPSTRRTAHTRPPPPYTPRAPLARGRSGAPRGASRPAPPRPSPPRARTQQPRRRTTAAAAPPVGRAGGSASRSPLARPPRATRPATARPRTSRAPRARLQRPTCVGDAAHEDVVTVERHAAARDLRDDAAQPLGRTARHRHAEQAEVATLSVAVAERLEGLAREREADRVQREVGARRVERGERQPRGSAEQGRQHFRGAPKARVSSGFGNFSLGIKAELCQIYRVVFVGRGGGRQVLVAGSGCIDRSETREF